MLKTCINSDDVLSRPSQQKQKKYLRLLFLRLSVPDVKKGMQIHRDALEIKKSINLDIIRKSLTVGCETKQKLRKSTSHLKLSSHKSCHRLHSVVCTLYHLHPQPQTDKQMKSRLILECLLFTFHAI